MPIVSKVIATEIYEKEVSMCREGSVKRRLALSATPELFRLIGYYLAEGSSYGGRVVNFDFNEKELETFAKDCAYLVDKTGRGFDRLVYVWGADHHGDVKRVLGAAQVLGIDPSRVQIVLYQLVSLYRGGEPVRMSKRTGEMISLDELLDEVGTDAARYTLLTRSPDTPLDFDIELVKRQSMDNPVYYVQYAHARIASLLRVASEQGVRLQAWKRVDLSALAEESELDLLRTLSELPEVVELSAQALTPHRLAHYAEEIAAAFHRFYTECRVITEDAPLTQARLWLSTATKQVVATTLGLLGVSAPQSMERIGGDEH